MLCPDEVVPERQRLAYGLLEHPLGRSGQRQLLPGVLNGRGSGRSELPAHRLDLDAELVQDLTGQSVCLAQQPKQEVLAAHVRLPQDPRFLLRDRDHASGALGEALEHAARLPRGDAAEQSAKLES